MGETILHLCLLNATSLHADLAKRLLKFYPKLINDVYMNDEFYGTYLKQYYFLYIEIIYIIPNVRAFAFYTNQQLYSVIGEILHAKALKREEVYSLHEI